jgi:hypothetical protein
MAVSAVFDPPYYEYREINDLYDPSWSLEPRPSDIFEDRESK